MRCYYCNKKYGLISFKCKCGKIFCINHRYTDLHLCEFDHKLYEREKLKNNNPKIEKDKIENRI